MARFAQHFHLFVICSVTFSLLNSCCGAKIVVMPKFGNSLYFMFQRIAEELGSRGHEVTLLIGSEQRYQPSEKYETLTFKSFLTSSAHKEHLSNNIKDNKFPLRLLTNLGSRLPYLQLMQCESLFNNTNKVVLEKLRGTALVVADAFFFCTLLLAEYLDALRVDFFAAALLTPLVAVYDNPSPLSYVPTMRSGSTDEMNFMERLRNVAVWFIYYYAAHYKLFYSGLEAMKTKYNIKPEISTKETRQNAELVLFATDFVLDIPQPLNPAKFAASLSPNVMAVDWFPQNDLLGHPKTRAFVSHVGLNSLQEAAYHGVPMIGIPLWGDQHDNAIRMARVGMGLWMQLYRFTSDELYEAIRKVIEEKSFKANATRVSRILKDRRRTPPQETADWVEYVLRHGGAKHLRPKVFNITWYQYYLLDVALFVAAILFVVIKVLLVLCRCLCRICKDKTKHKTD